jgi:hypothetical protein
MHHCSSVWTSHEFFDHTGSLVKRLGRPPGKRSDPDFEQVTAYIRKETHQAVKIELLKNGRQEFSALVEGLLQQWLKERR